MPLEKVTAFVTRGTSLIDFRQRWLDYVMGELGYRFG